MLDQRRFCTKEEGGGVGADPTEAKVKAAVSPLPPSSSTNGAAESPIGDPERTAITTGTSNTHREYPRSYGHLGYNYDLVIGGTLSSSKQAKRTRPLLAGEAVGTNARSTSSKGRRRK